MGKSSVVEVVETIGAAIVSVLYGLLQATIICPVSIAYPMSPLAVPSMYLKAIRVLVSYVGSVGTYATGLNVGGQQGLRLVNHQFSDCGCDGYTCVWSIMAGDRTTGGMLSTI